MYLQHLSIKLSPTRIFSFWQTVKLFKFDKILLEIALLISSALYNERYLRFVTSSNIDSIFVAFVELKWDISRYSKERQPENI